MYNVTRLDRSKAQETSSKRLANEVKGGKTILIAGGAGFLGSSLCRRYLEFGCRVICVDNLSTGRLKNLSDLRGHKNFSFLLHDIILPLTIDEKVDHIFNMACPASPPKYQSDPIQTLKTSLFGAFNLLELARSTDARILQASTSEIYGDPNISPQRETYFGNVNTFGPRSCYDEGKRAAETIFHDYHECYGVDLRIARIFNAYGPGMDPMDGRVVSNFINQALSNEAITIFGDGSQSRSFCYLDDMVDGLMALMHSSPSTFEPINIGNPNEFTVRELADLVLSKIKTKSQITYCDLPQDDPRQRRPDISQAQLTLGWSPRVELAEGLDQTIAYFLEERGGETSAITKAVG